MNKYAVEFKRQFQKELKLAQKRGMDVNLLRDVIQYLANDIPLPPRHRNHMLQGSYRGMWECHITPDWLLIYTKDTEIRIITLQHTGTHSDLFKSLPPIH